MKDLADKVTLLAPQMENAHLSRFLESRTHLGHKPFDERRVDSISRISQAILKDSVLRQDPSCVALGYWLRKSNLARIQEAFEKQQKLETEILFVPTGKIFHVTPANIDTLFVYSWALSYLCGNANVLRLSSRSSPVVEGLIRVLCEQMKSDELLAEHNLFLTYEHDLKISETLSQWCTHRIVWGGNETVQAFRPIALNPHASERVFASKFSYAIFSIDLWMSSTSEQKAKTAAAFFNDAFWFDQMACSSPHVIFWVGDQERTKSALASFESALEAQLKERDYPTDASTSMKRLAFSFKVAADSDVRVRLHEGAFVSIEQMDRRELEKEFCGGGFFRHVHVNDVRDIAEFAGQEDQTVTYFGLSSEEVRTLALELGARGVDRIVPVGEALAFDFNWDGFNLVQDFLRRVVIRR